MLKIWLVNIQIATPILCFGVFSWATAGPSLPFLSNFFFFFVCSPIRDLEDAAVSSNSNRLQSGTVVMVVNNVICLEKIFGERELLDQNTSELRDGSDRHKQTSAVAAHIFEERIK